MENKLAEIRSGQYMSQGKLAELLKVSQKTISSWEIGRTSPKPSQMQHIEDIFDTPKEEIFLWRLTTKMS